jgi:hypothetical protein
LRFAACLVGAASAVSRRPRGFVVLAVRADGPPVGLELGLWFVARDALRAGRLFRPVGRRYADPAGFLMPDERWQADRRELAVTFGRTRFQ